MLRLPLLVALSLSAVVALPPRDDRGRPVILMVHGRGMGDRDTASLRGLWRDGLESGAKNLSRSSIVADRDIRLVWYADVLDPSSAERCTYGAADPRAKRDAATDPQMKSFVSLVGNVLGALTALVNDKESATELRSLSADAAFLADAGARCAAERRLADAIDRAGKEGRPVIIVAHSLGSLVAYDYLTSRRDSGVVQRVVSVGSPLGSSELRRFLIGGDSTDAFTLPSSVKTWVNIRNAGDPFATPLSLGKDIVTTTPPDEPDTHEMIGYLRNSTTAGAILGAWCAAFVGSTPAGCADLPR